MQTFRYFPFTSLSLWCLCISLAQANLAAASSSLDRSKLHVSFVATVAELPAPRTLPQQIEEQRTPSDGQALTSADVLRMSKALTATREEGLFRNARLSVVLENQDRSIAIREEIASCAQLDLFSSEHETFHEKASCDGSTFGFGMTPNGPVVTLNGEPFRLLALREGVYLLNGVPFRIDPQ